MTDGVRTENNRHAWKISFNFPSSYLVNPIFHSIYYGSIFLGINVIGELLTTGFLGINVIGELITTLSSPTLSQKSFSPLLENQRDICC